jgi:hypothetical protein
MFGSEDTIARDGIHLIVSTPEGRSYRLGRDLHRLILTNEGETWITTSIEYESEIAGEDRGASPNLPDHLHRSLGRRGESAEAFIAGKIYHLWLTKKAAPESRISFTIKPDPIETIYIFKDQKVRGRVSTIHVTFQLAEETNSPLRMPTETRRTSRPCACQLTFDRTSSTGFFSTLLYC